jgi:hypothetical protein
MVRYACRDHHSLKPLAYYLSLCKILADGAGRGIVTTFTMVGCPNRSASVTRITTGGKPWQMGVRNNWLLVQSKKIVQALAKKRQPADHNGEKPS